MRNVFTIVLDGYMFVVKVENDYHVKGSFDPDAACDLEYYGYRETEFSVLNVREKVYICELSDWMTCDEDSSKKAVDAYSNQIELEVQYLLDKQKGDV